MKIRLSFFALAIVCCLLTSCGERATVSWEQLIRDLYVPESIADLSAPSTEIYTSYDRTGGNNDYGGGVVPDGEGWLTLADLKGPGVMTRFWFTGVGRASVFRFIFDDETKPRLEMSVGEFYRQTGSFPVELSQVDQNCFTSYFPIPYSKRLHIMVSNDGYHPKKRKLYYQVNATSLKRRTVESVTFPASQQVLSAAEKAGSQSGAQAETEYSGSQPFEIGAKATAPVLTIDGAGLLQELRVEPEGWAAASFEQRVQTLRSIWVRMFWEGSQKASVSVPLGDLFGQMWQPCKVDSLYFSGDQTGLTIRFPMPFKTGCRIELENFSPKPFRGTVSWKQSNHSVPETYGYFHCAWTRSAGAAHGRPHTVLKTEGRGRLAGCLLGVASLEPRFWVLESDETITRDREKEPFWQGTGLEDYFNGGWYYRNVFCLPLYGLPSKRPFRTLQYRFHLSDAIPFKKELEMSFERGPDNQNNATFDSVAFYYLKKPSAAFSSARPAFFPAPSDQFEARSLMTRLWDYERFDDFDNAEKLLQYALEKYQYPPTFKNILQQRLHAYQTPEQGGQTLVGLFANKKTKLYIDGNLIIQSADPQRTAVQHIDLLTGQHVAVVETEVDQWPDGVLVFIKKGEQVLGTDLSWRCALNPSGPWHELDYDDSAWSQNSKLVKGPPELEAVPFIYPDPYVGCQSKVDGVRSGFKKRRPGDVLILRKVIDVQ